MGWIKDLPNSIHNPDSPTYTGGATSGSELSLGGDGSGFSMPNSVYNPYTGRYEAVGGTENHQMGTGYEGAGSYKQHVDLGSGQNYWIPVVDGEPIMTLEEAKSGGYNWVPSASGVGVVLDTGQGVTQPPTGGGGGGTQPPVGGGTLPPTETPLPPITNEPTDDWYWTDPVGYENAPPPDGTGEFVEGGPPPDTSWDWSFFRDRAPGDRQWGGFDEDYQAFERYIPGQDSPWGLPNVEGGNEDFYQQQFLNQLRDEQGYQNRERAAQMRRYEASLPENQAEPISGEEMWEWAYGGRGLPDVTMGGSPREQSWELSSALQPGQTNSDVWRWAAGLDRFKNDDYARKQLQRMLATGEDESTYWTSIGDPNKIIQNLGKNPDGLTGKNRALLSEIANAMYNQSSMGPVAPSNYASPVQWGSSYPGAATGGA
jgi:hypothetical protein